MLSAEGRHNFVNNLKNDLCTYQPGFLCFVKFGLLRRKFFLSQGNGNSIDFARTYIGLRIGFKKSGPWSEVYSMDPAIFAIDVKYWGRNSSITIRNGDVGPQRGGEEITQEDLYIYHCTK